VSKQNRPHPNAAPKPATPPATTTKPQTSAPSDRNIEQRRAAYALDKIRKVRDLKGGSQARSAKDYRSYISGFPATILVNGLGQASAAILAQSRGNRESAHKLIYDHLSGWLCGGDPQSPYQRGDLIEQIVTNDQAHYLRAQAEALAVLEWLKRFAVALLSDPSDSDGGGDR
jgi:CRISPR-associated protein Cmr5